MTQRRSETREQCLDRHRERNRQWWAMRREELAARRKQRRTERLLNEPEYRQRYQEQMQKYMARRRRRKEIKAMSEQELRDLGDRRHRYEQRMRTSETFQRIEAARAELWAASGQPCPPYWMLWDGPPVGQYKRLNENRNGQ